MTFCCLQLYNNSLHINNFTFFYYKNVSLYMLSLIASIFQMNFADFLFCNGMQTQGASHTHSLNHVKGKYRAIHSIQGIHKHTLQSSTTTLKGFGKISTSHNRPTFWLLAFQTLKTPVPVSLFKLIPGLPSALKTVTANPF